MKKILFALLTCFQFVGAESILTDFEQRGYHELLNDRYGTGTFGKLYDEFDALNDFIQSNPDFAEKIFEVDRIFGATDDNKMIGSPPIGYVSDVKSGKSKKNYFHYSKAYFDYMKKDQSDLLHVSQELNALLLSLEELSVYCEEKFENVIKEISSDIDISSLMHTPEGNLLLLLKIVKYEASDTMASNAHYDFSGLTFLLDNTDEGKETLLISPYKDELVSSDLVTPIRKYARNENDSSNLLIPGLALKFSNCPINPTPHAVGIQDSPRYAIIVFAMVPNMTISYDDIRIKVTKLPELY